MILNYEEGDVMGPGEEESTGPLMWDPSHVVSGKPAPGPRKPVGKPSKKPRQPVFLGEWEQEVAALGEQAKAHQATNRQIDAAMNRGGAFQGGLASGQQSVQPKLKTPLKRGYTKVQQGTTSKVVSPTGLPVSEGTYAQDVENRHPDVAQMWPSDSKEVARLDEIARLSQPGFGTALDRGMLRSNETLKNFGAGALSLIDDLGNAIHPTNFVGGDSEGMVHAMARKLSASSQDDAATIGGVSAQYGSPAEYLTEVGRGLPGMLGSVYLSTQMTGNPALGFAVQKMAEARGHGITDPKELAREGLLGLGEGQLFHMVGGMQGGLGRIATQGALGAAQPIGESLARGQGLPNAQTMIEGGLTNAILDMVPGMGGGIDHPARAAKALESLPIAQQLEVGTALADPSPRSFASLAPKVREAAMLNWHMDAHPSLKEADGRPKTFYHGTPYGEIGFFDPQSDGNVGSHFGTVAAAHDFTDGLSYVESETMPTIYPVHLNIKNPAITLDVYPITNLERALKSAQDQDGNPIFTPEEGGQILRRQLQNPKVNLGKAFKAALEAKGYDGIQYVNRGEDIGHTSQIVFYPHQVKSAFAKEFDPQSIRMQASFRPNELKQMEQRAAQAGKPLALTPETRDAYTARNQEIKAQLLAADPASPEFARLADEHSRLARAIDDSPVTVPQSAEELRQHLVQMNMGHEGAALEMMDILRPSADGAPLKMDADKFKAARQSSIQGARFYPLDNETKGGSVYLTPQTFEDTGLIDKGQRSDIGAINVPLDEAWNAAARVQESQPDVASALMGAIKEAETKGLSRISILSYAEGQGLAETRKLMRHESFHTGQQAAAEAADVMGIDPRDLHPPDLIYNTILTKAAQTENGQSILKYYDGNLHDMALELAAYSAANQHDYVGLSKEEAANYLTDYLTGISDLHGVETLDALAGTARLSPRVKKLIEEISSNAKPKKNFGQANRDFAAQLRTQPSASGGPPRSEGRSEGSGGVDEGRVAESGDQDEVGRVVGGPVESEGVGAPPTDGGDGGTTPPDNSGPQRPIEPPNELFTEVIGAKGVKELVTRVSEEAARNGVELDKRLPKHLQILEAVRNHPELLDGNSWLVRAMREEGFTFDSFMERFQTDASEQGRMLGAWASDVAYYRELLKTDPKLARRGMGEANFRREGIDDIMATELGQSRWDRLTGLEQMAVLGQLATYWTNQWSTALQIPMNAMADVVGAIGYKLMRGKDAPPIGDTLKAAIKPSLEVMWRFTPDKLEQALRRDRASNKGKLYDQLINGLEVYHPEAIRHLKGFEYKQFNTPENRVLLEELADAISKGGSKKQKEDLAKFQARDKSNQRGIGKVLGTAEWGYSQFLRPLMWQEMAYRKPLMFGEMDREMTLQGKNLRQMIMEGNLKKIDKTSVERSVDGALTTTWGYKAKMDNPDAALLEKKLENVGYLYQKAMGQLGPAAILIDLFARSTTNAVKFVNEWGPWGAMSPGWQVGHKMFTGNRADVTYQEAQRLGKAMIGTTMYALALGLAYSPARGPMWYQIATGKKDKDGKPVYFDGRNIPQLAVFMGVADVIKRVHDGTMNDVDAKKQIAQAWFQSRRTGREDVSGLNEVLKMWSSDATADEQKWNRSIQPIGDMMAMPLTPLLNFRDFWAQFSEREGSSKDVSQQPLLGPALSKLPFFNQYLPDRQPFTEPAPQAEVYAPLASKLFPGLKMDTPVNFATSEFQRLGLSPTRWLRPDPDPLINRAQYAAYADVLQELGPALEADPTYKAASDAEKAAMWEQLLSGPEGYASMAKAQGELANPEEIQRRELLKTQGPLQRKASGLEKEVKEMKKQAQPRP